MHIYVDSNSKIFLPSVTSIISFVKTEKEYEGLIRWANTLGYYHKDYNETLNTYADFGTTVHEALSYIVTNKGIPDTFERKITLDDLPKYEMTLNNFYKFYRQNNPETIFSEKSLISEKLGYGGTIDWVCIENNKIILTDFKTSSSIRDYMPLQLAAYIKLMENQTDIKIDKARIMLVSTKTFTIKEYDLNIIDSYYKKFDLIHQLFNEYHSDVDWKSAASENSLIIV
jgi:hypothetical protein